MHELSIAISLVELAEEAARSAAGSTIDIVRVQIGDASGVVAEALELAWDAAREDTRCASAALEIERVPVRVHCAACAQEHDLDGPFCLLCPECGAPTPDVVAGRELDLIALVLTEPIPTEPAPLSPSEVHHAAAHP